MASTLVKTAFETSIATFVDIEVDRGAQALGIFDVGREPTKFFASMVGKKNMNRQAKNALSSVVEAIVEDYWYQIPFMEFFE